MVRILLVRHGQSEWNAIGKWQGRSDTALSELGQAQARAACALLGSFDLIAASTLERASHTAAIIAEHLGIGPVIPVPDLVERDVGEWSGLTRADIDQQWPGYLDDGRRPPGFEDEKTFRDRVILGLTSVARLLPDSRGTALVVAHGGLIYALENLLNQRAGRIPNLGALWVDVAADGTIDIGHRVELVDEDLVSVSAPDAL